MQKFSRTDPAQVQMPVIGKAADPTLHDTVKHTRRYLREELEKIEIDVGSKQLSKRPRRKAILVLRSTATTKACTPEPGTQQTVKNGDCARAEGKSDDKQSHPTIWWVERAIAAR